VKKVSVILTTYNSEYQIQEVIDSIYNQQGKGKLFEIELIVVDDCSTDSTQKILSKNDIDFSTTSKNSGGPNRGRNIGLKQCTGDFICIMDHDDIWFPNRLKSLLSVTSIAPIVTSGYILQDNSSFKKEYRYKKLKNNKTYLKYNKNLTFISKITRDKMGQETYLGSILFCKSLKHIFFEEEYGMIDFDWILKLFYNQHSVEFCQALYLRKVQGNNLSLNEKYRINDYHYSLKTILSYKEEYPDLVEISIKKLNGSMGRYYYLMDNMRFARKYLLKSTLEIKTILYLITTFVGSKIVKKYFKVFG
tara:strand:- start:339 stop:1253 length:915 start_codon:yes stop_codon:yes gene_type:complete